MDKMQKLFGIVSLVALVLSIVAFGYPKVTSKPYLGGSFNPVKVDFAQGISVGGTEIITSAGVYKGAISSTGALSGTTGTFSSTLAVTGASTMGTVASRYPVLAPAADTTLTVAQSGSFVKMNTAGQDMTLPTASTASGVHYRFAVTAAVATTDMTIIASPADTIEGTLIVAGAVVDCDASDIITFVIDGENIGDFVELYSDGTSWLIGESGTLTAAKMTCSG